jgi:hypothetical protein
MNNSKNRLFDQQKHQKRSTRTQELEMDLHKGARFPKIVLNIRQKTENLSTMFKENIIIN